MPSPSTAIRVVPVVYPNVQESSHDWSLDCVSDSSHLRIVRANREAEKSVAMVAFVESIALCPLLVHPGRDLRSEWVRVPELHPAVRMGAPVVFGDSPMTTNC